MGKFSKVTTLREAWSSEELKSLEASRTVVAEVEKHKSLVRTTVQDLKTHSRKLEDLKIRRDISRNQSPAVDIFPAIVNSHVQESLKWEISERISKLAEAVENLSKSLKSVEIAAHDLEMSFQMIPLREENASHQYQELIRILSYILDASSSIFAYYSRFQVHLELVMEENGNLEALGIFDDTEESAKHFGIFVNEFLCQCRVEPTLRWQRDNETEF